MSTKLFTKFVSNKARRWGRKERRARGRMDVVLAVQQYVARMTDGVSGMKALLLDKEV